MISVRDNVTILARIIGRSSLRMPYVSQRITPREKMIYIISEMSRVCRVLMTFRVCGRNATVVKVAAQSPTIVVVSILAPVFYTKIAQEIGNTRIKWEIYSRGIILHLS